MRTAAQSDFVRKVGETFGAKILLILMGLASTVLVARALGPEGRGEYAIAFALVSIGVQFGNLGLHSSATYYVSRNKSTAPVLIVNSLVAGFGLGGVMGLLGWGACRLFPSLAPVQDPLLWGACLAIPFSLSGMFLQNLLLGLNRVRFYNLTDIIGRSLSLLALGIVLAFTPVTVEKVFFCGILAPMAIFFLGLWFLRPWLIPVAGFSWALLKGGLPYGLKAYLACFFAFLLLKIDLLMVKYLLGASDAGQYSISSAMADMLYLFPAVVGTVLFPRLSTLPGLIEKWKLAKNASLVLGGIMLMLAGGAALVASPVVRLMFGAEFLPSVPAFLWLCPAMVFYGINNILSVYLASVGLPWFGVQVWVLAAGANIVLNGFLIPALGISGAAIASLLCYALVLLVQYIYVLQHLNADESRP